MRKHEQETMTNNLAEEIKYQRKKRHWSQEDLALECGVSKNEIGRIERSDSIPKLETIERMEKALHLPPFTLLRLSQEDAQNVEMERMGEIDKTDLLRKIETELSKNSLTTKELKVVLKVAIATIHALK